MVSLESPYRGDSNENIKHTIFKRKKKIPPNYPKYAAIRFFLGTKNEFKIAVVNEPSVFEPLKFYCSYTTVCPPVPGDNPRALEGRLYSVQVDKLWYKYYH